MLARYAEPVAHQPLAVPRAPVAREIGADRLSRMRHGYACRRVPRSCMLSWIQDYPRPRPGDLVLVRVLTAGRVDSLELANATVAPLQPGDEVIACFSGTATDGPWRLARASGIVDREPAHRYGAETEVAYLGVLGDRRGNVLNIANWATPPGLGDFVSRPVIALIGDRHLPGESSRVVDMVRGLSASGFRVGVANISGVPGCWKTRLLEHAGAGTVLDTADAGVASVRGESAEVIERIFVSLYGCLCASGADIVLVEVEQDVFDQDVATLITLPGFQGRVSTVVLEGREGSASTIERDSLRAMGFDVTLVDEPGHRPRYQALS